MGDRSNQDIWEEITTLREELNALKEKKTVLQAWSTEIKDLAEEATQSLEQIKELAGKVGVVFND